MTITKELIDNEINKIKDLVLKEKEKKEIEIQSLKEALDNEKSKNINIVYNLDKKNFVLNDVFFGESIKFEGKSFESVFSLWEKYFNNTINSISSKIKSNEKELIKLNEFLKSIKDNVSINVLFGVKDNPVITYNFTKKYAFIKKIVS